MTKQELEQQIEALQAQIREAPADDLPRLLQELHMKQQQLKRWKE